MNRILSIGIYLLMGWFFGAMLSSDVSFAMANVANFWFWAWLIVWPILLLFKFIWFGIILFVVVGILLFAFDKVS